MKDLFCIFKRHHSLASNGATLIPTRIGSMLERKTLNCVIDYHDSQVLSLIQGLSTVTFIYTAFQTAC